MLPRCARRPVDGWSRHGLRCDPHRHLCGAVLRAAVAGPQAARRAAVLVPTVVSTGRTSAKVQQQVRQQQQQHCHGSATARCPSWPPTSRWPCARLHWTSSQQLPRTTTTTMSARPIDSQTCRPETTGSNGQPRQPQHTPRHAIARSACLPMMLPLLPQPLCSKNTQSPHQRTL
jgi:hypothetical protein